VGGWGDVCDYGACHPFKHPLCSALECLLLFDCLATYGIQYTICSSFLHLAVSVVFRFLTSVTQTIPQFLSVARLTAAFHRLGVLAYGDYSELPAVPVTSFSGWHTRVKDIFPFAAHLEAAGGGDFPEAAKTAACAVLKNVERQTVVLWYTDAPPHARSPLAGNGTAELRELGSDNFDWVRLCRRLAAAHVTVYPIISDVHMAQLNSRWYTFIAAATGGTCIIVRDTAASTITRTTINVLVRAGGGMQCVRG
jgi:hypothetical protein